MYVLRWVIPGVQQAAFLPHHDRAMLERWADELNRKHGEGTHWVEPATPLPEWIQERLRADRSAYSGAAEAEA